MDEASLRLVKPSPTQDKEDDEENHISKYRRKGLQQQRRLSRINLVKHLALSDTSELKMQWIVDFKNL